MPKNPYIRLYGPSGYAVVRSAVTAADAGTWTPDDETTPSDFALDAREWETVRVVVETTMTNVTVQALRMLRTGSGRLWPVLSTHATLANNGIAEVAIEGGFAAFRVSAITGAGTTTLRVTGGRLRRNLAGG